VLSEKDKKFLDNIFELCNVHDVLDYKQGKTDELKIKLLKRLEIGLRKLFNKPSKNEIMNKIISEKKGE